MKIMFVMLSDSVAPTYLTLVSTVFNQIELAPTSV